MKIGVVGAAGRQAAGTIRDLSESPEITKVVLIDLPSTKEELSRRSQQWCHQKGEIKEADVNDQEKLRSALKGCVSAANCTSHVFNLAVMEACLAEKVHYTDMGGLFHWARKQMLQHQDWENAGLTAVLGMGSAPGIVNVMGSYAAGLLDEVESFLIRDGIVNYAKTDAPMVVPYAMGTILDEFVDNAFIFENGDWKEVRPFDLPEQIDFPPPVGRQTVFATIHSEVATVPVTFRSKGLKHMSFKLSLPRAFEEKMRFLVGLGFGDKKDINIEGQKVSPRKVLVELCEKLPKPSADPDDYKCLRVDVSGKKEDKRHEIRIEMMMSPYKPWEMGSGPFGVGFPVGLCLRMLAKGQVQKKGALPPEACIPHQDFFRGLAERGLSITCSDTYSVIDR